MSIEGDNAEKKARALLDSLQKYNNKILGDDLEESILDRVNKAKEDYLNNET